MVKMRNLAGTVEVDIDTTMWGPDRVAESASGDDITPAMIEAGVRVLEQFNRLDDSERGAVTDIYRAMRAAAR